LRFPTAERNKGKRIDQLRRLSVESHNQKSTLIYLQRGVVVSKKNAVDREIAGAIAELLEALTRDIVSREFTRDLNPAQWAALRFVNRANSSARSVTAFARARRTTTGTATRTVAALVHKGYLRRIPSTEDRRYDRLELTAKGDEALRADPLLEVAAAIGGLPGKQRRALLEALLALQRVVAPERGPPGSAPASR
jgi:DNA-binding MarR family transcriptional regulator